MRELGHQFLTLRRAILLGFLEHWRLTERGEAFSAHVVSYADDFVILSRGRAAEALTWTKMVMTKLGLALNEAKTSLRHAWQDRWRR
jgi:RNA-directed DNA polymerase